MNAYTTLNTAIATAIREGFDRLQANPLVPQIAYDSRWENGTGYLDGLAEAQIPDTGYCSVVKTVDPNGRKILVMQIDGRRAVLFERYTDSKMLVGHSAQKVYARTGSSWQWMRRETGLATGDDRMGMEAYLLIKELDPQYTRKLDRQQAA